MQVEENSLICVFVKRLQVGDSGLWSRIYLETDHKFGKKLFHTILETFDEVVSKFVIGIVGIRK